jgi:hypothetical protein
MNTGRQQMHAQPSLEPRIRTSTFALLSCLLGIVDFLAVPTPYPVLRSLAGGSIGWEAVGMVGVVGCYLLLITGAIASGHLARRLIRRSQGALGGSFCATTGLILGYSSLTMFVVILLTTRSL